LCGLFYWGFTFSKVIAYNRMTAGKPSRLNYGEKIMKISYTETNNATVRVELTLSDLQLMRRITEYATGKDDAPYGAKSLAQPWIARWPPWPKTCAAPPMAS
jgi:hypothetical protein